MNKEYIYRETKRLAIDNGADEHAAESAALTCADQWARGMFDKKVVCLIEEHAKMACGITGKKRLKSNKKQRKAQTQEAMF
jgi:hypothetical protein